MNSKNLLKTISFVCAILVSSSVFAADLDEMQAFEASFQQLSSNFVQTRSVRLLASAPAPTTVAEETTRATAAETSLQNNIASETSARIGADSILQEQIDDHTTDINNNKNAIASETSARIGADSILQEQIDTHSAYIGNMNFSNTKYIRNDTDLSSAVRTLDANFAQMNTRLDDLNQKVEKHHKEMKRGFASLAAMTRLVPNARSGCDTQLAIGMGSYRGSKGFAVGAFHYIDNNTLINAGVGYAGHNSTTFGVGLTFGF